MKNDFAKKLKNLIEGKIIFLATSDKKGNPNIIAAEVNYLSGEKEVIITNNCMVTTAKNILATRKASILLTDNKTFWWRIKTKANCSSKGKWFDFVKGLKTNTGYVPKGVLILKIKEVYDLDKGKLIVSF